MCKNKVLKFLTVLLFVASLSACATTNPSMVSDPIEPVNRAVFSFNDLLDKVLLNPIAKTYKTVVPNVVRNSVRNFFRNLKTPVTLANNLMQGDGEAAGVTTARFLFNTFLGVGGLIDFAETQGLEYEPEDFGQTLASWNVGSGAYLVLPVLGPSTVRDSTGMVIDMVIDPIRVINENADNGHLDYWRVGVQGLDTKSRVVDGMEDLRINSLDYYSSVRSAYIQSRIKLINEGKDVSEQSDVPSYDDFE